MLALFAAVVAAACIWASARRIAYAVAPTPLDIATLSSALRGSDGKARLASLTKYIGRARGAEWESALLDAAAAAPHARAALVNEQLGEYDHSTKRWDRVPRVCASISSSSGFLLAAVALRIGVRDPSAFDPSTGDAVRGALLTGALNCVALGIAGAAFSIAAIHRARAEARSRLDAVDKLVDRLERIAGSDEPP
jgi:hypothetical protein